MPFQKREFMIKIAYFCFYTQFNIWIFTDHMITADGDCMYFIYCIVFITIVLRLYFY